MATITSASRRFIAYFCLCLVALSFYLYLARDQLASPYANRSNTVYTNYSTSSQNYAFALFLADYSGGYHGPDEDDKYYLGTRIIVHQLLHAPKTRTNTSIPLVILATEDVAPHRIARLRKDGGDVRIIEKIKLPSWVPVPRNHRWQDIFTKLRIFELEEFDKVLLMDSDLLIVNRLDGIFFDSSTKPRLPDDSLALSDDAPLPSRYILSAQTINDKRKHAYPPKPKKRPYFGGGFWVCHPATDLFAYYMAILQIPQRFDPRLMEQEFLNYVHRREGPMPWTEFDYRWTSTWPSAREYNKGAVTLHEKWWDERIGETEETLDPFLRNLWLQAKYEMLEHWRSRD